MSVMPELAFPESRDPWMAHRRSRLVAAVVPVALAITMLVVIGGAKAHANYTVTECSNNAALDAALTAGGAFSISHLNQCGPGGWGLRLEAESASAQGGWKAWNFYAAPGTRFATSIARVHYRTDAGYGPMTNGDGAPGYASVGSAGPNQWEWPVQNNTSHFTIALTCFAAGGCPSGSSAYAYTDAFTAEVQDFHPPSVSASGELLDGGVVRGVQTLQTSSSDFGGGARSISVYVNGLYSKGVDFCPPLGGVYTTLKPCPDTSGARVLSLDTQNDPGWANGPNDVTICAGDVSGNVSSPCIRRTVHVDNSCPTSGAQQGSQLESGVDVGGRLRSLAAIRSTQSPLIRGRLTNADGDPIAGSTVCAYETVELEDASSQLVSTATTQANGRFVTRLDPGPSREVELVYRYNTRTLQRTLQLDSTVVPTLKLAETSLRNGERAHFTGRLPDPNAAGRLVALQARAGRKWRTFKQLRTDEGGTFKGLYRFTQTSGRARYVFRALVKRQGGYPYEPGSSRKRKLFVRG